MGDRLRQARHARGLSLRRLADVLGMSPSLISQVETGRAKPSVNTLYALANELGISLDVLLFMDTAPPTQEVTDGGDGDGLPDAPPPALPHDPVQPASSRSTYEVGGESSPEDAFQRHTGQEWGYILSGSLMVRIGFEEYLLGPGDAISFDSATPHRLFNAGDIPAKAVWFVLGRRSADVAKR